MSDKPHSAKVKTFTDAQKIEQLILRPLHGACVCVCVCVLGGAVEETISEDVPFKSYTE